MTSVLDELTAKRADANQDFTPADERKCLSAIIALLQEKKVVEIKGNESLFATLFDKYSAYRAITEGADMQIRNTREYYLLYYYYLDQRCSLGHVKEPIAAATLVLEAKADYSIPDPKLHDEHLQYFLHETACGLRGKRTADTDVDSVLSYIITAISDLCDSREKPLTNEQTKDDSLVQERAASVRETIVEMEKKFSVAFFYISVFANLPASHAEKYADLAEKCSDDVKNLFGSEPGLYHAIWLRICTTATEMHSPWIVDAVLNVGRQMFNTRNSFALFHNRHLLGTCSAGVEGLIATFCRFSTLMTFRNQHFNALGRLLSLHFVQMRASTASVNDILLCFKHIIAAASVVMYWTDLIDSVSGRFGEGALRLACAVDEIAPQKNGDPSFFYRLDAVQSTEYCYEMLDANSGGSEFFFIVGPTLCRFQVRAVFAKNNDKAPTADVTQLTTAMRVDVTQLTTAMRVLYDNTNGDVDFPIVNISQCLYFESFGKIGQICLSTALKSVLENHKQQGNRYLNDLVVAHAANLKELQHLKTFAIDWNYLCTHTARAIITNFTVQQTAALRIEMDKCLAEIREAVATENLAKQRTTQRKHNAVRVSQREEEKAIKDPNLLYRDGSQLGLDDRNAPIQKQPRSRAPPPSAALAPLSAALAPTTLPLPPPVDRSRVDSQAETEEEKGDEDDDVDDKLPKRVAKKNIAPKEKKNKVVDDKRPERETKKVQKRKQSHDADENAQVGRSTRKESAKTPVWDVCFAVSNATAQQCGNNPKYLRRFVAQYFFNWPFCRDLNCVSGKQCETGFEEIVEFSAFASLFPLIHPTEIFYAKEDAPDAYFMNFWTINYDDWPERMKGCQSDFDKRRKVFLNTWVKKIWPLSTGEYLVHLDKDKANMEEFDRLTLGYGFLIFSKELIDQCLTPRVLKEKIANATVTYPWLNGDDALPWLNPTDKEHEDVVFSDENRFDRGTYGDLKQTKMTVAELCTHLAVEPKSLLPELPKPKSGAKHSGRAEQMANFEAMKNDQSASADGEEDDGDEEEDGEDDDGEEKDNEDDDDDKPLVKKARRTAAAPPVPVLGIVGVEKDPREFEDDLGDKKMIRLVQRLVGKKSEFCKMQEKDFQRLLEWRFDTFDSLPKISVPLNTIDKLEEISSIKGKEVSDAILQ